MLADEIREAVRKRGKGLFIIFTSKSLGPGRGVKHGTGRGSIAKRIADLLGGEYLSTGNIFREKAREMGMDIYEMQDYAKGHPEFDVEVDDAAIKRVENTIKGGGIIVADSNFLAYLVKDNTVRIIVDCDDETRARRVIEGHRFGDRKLSTVSEALEYLDSRSKKFVERFKNHRMIRYREIDMDDQSFFDGTVDNSGELDESVEQALMIISKVIA